MTPRNCDRCRAETQPMTVESVHGESDPLRITLYHFPLLKCPEGHCQFVRPEFGAELLEHLIQEDEPGLPAGDEKGLILKKYFCESCGEKLLPKPDHRHSFAIEVPLQEMDPLGVELSMPVYCCSSCGKQQLHSLREVRKLTPAALAEAFKNADIPPPPGVI